MSISQISNVFQSALAIGLRLAAPILGVAIVVGLVVAIFQAASQIHEQTLSFVPKLVAIALVLVLLGPWMMETLMDFTRNMFDLMLRLE